jgi:hypothetical protein
VTKVASGPPAPSSDVPELPEPPPSVWLEPPDWLEPLEPVELPEPVEPLLPLSRVDGELFPHDAISGSAPPPAVMARARMVRNERSFIGDAFQMEVSAEDFRGGASPKPIGSTSGRPSQKVTRDPVVVFRQPPPT